MRNLRRQANGFSKGWMRVDRFANIHRVRTHLNGQRNLANHVARVGADHAAAQDLAMAVCFWGSIKQQLGHAFVAAIGYGTAGCGPGEQALLDLDALGFGLVFGEAHPGHFGVGVGHAGDDSCVESGRSQLFVALQLTGNHFGCHMRFVHRLVRQHGLAHDVADGEDVGHVGAHLDVNVDEATVRDGHTGLLGADLLAIGRKAYGLQDQVVSLRLRGSNDFWLKVATTCSRA